MASDPRDDICRTIGINNIIAAHEIITAGAKRDPKWLLQRKINAGLLRRIGYTDKYLARMGYSIASLKTLGFFEEEKKAQEQHELSHASASDDRNTEQKVRAMVHAGESAGEIKHAGYSIHNCKRAGFDAREMLAIGFSLDELISVYGLVELRSVGFNARELSRLFSGDQLRAAGFSATEMRMGGFSVRDLIKFGYNENHIIAAGYSLNELSKEGLGRQTRIL